jgi:ABC-type Fe3+ transport system permease subunit
MRNPFRKKKEQSAALSKFEQQRALNRKNARRRARRDAVEKIFVYAAAGVGFVVAVAGLMIFGSLFGYFGWNHGVVNIIKACHGHASGITLWTALFTSMALGVVHGSSRLNFKRNGE